MQIHKNGASSTPRFKSNRGLVGLGASLKNAIPMGSKGPQPIMDQQESVTKELTAEQWNFAQGRLQPSMAAMDKLEKEGLKMVQIVGRDKKRDPLFVKLSLGSFYLAMFFLALLICHQFILDFRNQNPCVDTNCSSSSCNPRSPSTVTHVTQVAQAQ